jgi:glycosyltransferase involved in cell wall biosynthesis
MIKVVSCFWNAEQYITNCIKTLKNQIDKDFEVYLIDDMSNDKSVSIIKSLILDDDRFKLIVNTEKKFKLKNLDELISTFNDDDIIVELDGDDFLLGNEVIGDIRKMYSNKDTWLTNGSFMYSNMEIISVEINTQRLF